jgi:hypothetical protein
MNNLPAWSIAQALKEWRDALPESGVRNEVNQQIEARAREILARPPPSNVRLVNTTTARTALEVVDERTRQDAKWGVQNHPDLPPFEEARATPNAWFGLPTADDARDACEAAFRNKRGSYAHIFVEDVCEAIEAAPDPAKLREELIQCAAVAVAWVEAIDRRAKPIVPALSEINIEG